MRRFLIRRLVFFVIAMFGATFFVFSLSRMAGDPIMLYAKPTGYGMSPERIANLRAKLGLDKPFVVQYVIWVGHVARGDLGRTLMGEKPVLDVIQEKAGATAQLALAGWLVATIVGVPLGVLSAVARGSPLDYLARGFALFGQAVPAFWLGIVGVLIFSVQLGWLPSGFRGEGISVKHFILPAITVGMGSSAACLRLVRSAMLEVLDSDYVRFARAKGVPNQVVIWKHAFRNALLAAISVSALLLGWLLSGSIIAEVVFAWPGLGRVALLEAVDSNDFPLLLGSVLYYVLIFLTVSLVADLAYFWADPRIRMT